MSFYTTDQSLLANGDLDTGFFTPGQGAIPTILSQPFTGQLANSNAMIGHVLVDNQPAFPPFPTTLTVQPGDTPLNVRITASDIALGGGGSGGGTSFDGIIRNTTGQAVPVSIQGGVSTFNGVLVAGSAHIGQVSLDAPVALATGTQVGITGLVNVAPHSVSVSSLPAISGSVGITGNVSVNPHAVSVTALPAISGSVAITNPVTSLSINNADASPVPVKVIGGSTFSGVLANSNSHIGQVSLDQPVQIQGNVSVNPVTVASMPAITVANPVTAVTVGNADAAPVPVKIISGNSTFSGSLANGSAHIGQVSLDAPVLIDSSTPISVAVVSGGGMGGGTSFNGVLGNSTAVIGSISGISNTVNVAIVSGGGTGGGTSFSGVLANSSATIGSIQSIANTVNVSLVADTAPIPVYGNFTIDAGSVMDISGSVKVDTGAAPLDVNVVSGGASFSGVLANSTAVIGSISGIANTVSVQGSVAISNLPATQTVHVDNQPTSIQVSNLPLIQNVALAANTVVALASNSVVISNFPAVQPVNGSVAVSNFPTTQTVAFASTPTVSLASNIVQLASNAVSVSGAVSVSNFPATQAVTGSVSITGTPVVALSSNSVTVSNFPATQAVTLSSNAVSVSGSVAVSNFPATQQVTGSVAVSNFPATQAVSITGTPTVALSSNAVTVSNFPATQVVSGSVTLLSNSLVGIKGGDGGSLASNGNPLPVYVPGTVTARVQNASGDITAANPLSVNLTSNSVSISNFPAVQAVSGSVSITGTPSVNSTIQNASIPVTQSGTWSVTSTQSATVTVTDRSNSITTGGTAQSLMAANASRKGYWIQNTSSGDLFISDVGTASVGGSSLKIPAGSLYEAPHFGVSAAAFSIFGATAGQTFSAREW